LHGNSHTRIDLESKPDLAMYRYLTWSEYWDSCWGMVMHTVGFVLTTVSSMAEMAPIGPTRLAVPSNE
jgi:hypothetical protein